MCSPCASTAPRCATRSRPRSGADLHDVFTRLINDTAGLSLRDPDRHRRQGVLRGRRPERAQRHDRCAMDEAACAVRAHDALAARLPDPGDRRGERRGVRRRLRTDPHLRLRLREHDGALRPARDHARHHAGRGRHAVPAARRRLAPRQGDGADRQAVLGRGGARMGRGQQAVRAREADGRDARHRADDRQQRADRDPAGQALDALRHADGPALRAVLRDRRLQQDGRDRGPARGRQGVQRKAASRISKGRFLSIRKE